MNKKLVIGILVLGLAWSATAQDDPSLVGWWRLDEGAGTTAADSSGYGNNGAFVGEPAWVPGVVGSALQFDGTDDWVEIPHNDVLHLTEEVSLALWVNASRYNSAGENWGGIMAKGNVRNYSLFTTAAGELHFSTGGVGTVSSGTIPLDEWAHVTTMVKGGGHEYFINGEAAGTGGSGIVLPATNTNAVTFGNINETARVFQGMLDDVRIYNRGLTIDELPAIMKGVLPTTAANPIPEDGEQDVLRDIILTWDSSIYESTHNVYFGESYDAVSAATTPASSQGNTSFDPGRLDFGKTYFWRVDEVNVSADKTVYPGDVWSFEVEPYSVQIAENAIKVTASSVNNNSDPNNMINGSGLDADNLHSNSPDDMWMSANGDMSPSLIFELDGAQKLDKMLVWNSNHSSESVIGWGAKDVEIGTSMDGVDWAVLEGTTQLTQGPGFVPSEAQTVDMGLVSAKYVRINILSSWGGLLPQYGVAEVQLYALPTQARTPDPASGATGVLPDVVVTWRAGREADQHTVYVGADQVAVADGSAQSASSNTNSLDLTSLDLQMGQTYYWRVDEVNNVETPAVVEGAVWSLSTATKLVVDDFESYGNLSPDRPFQTWLDGVGYSADEFFPVEYGGNGTGAAIGHDIWSVSSPHFDGDIMETTITIAGSSQSMPFYFNGASETERVLAMDFTLGGAKTLSIPFRGQTGNTGTLYVKINGVKVTYPRDAANIAKAGWQVFNIDLASVGTDLTNVTKLAIGVEGNASGMILIDDITLHTEAGETITPVDPGNAGLVLNYAFDEGAGSSITDSSGNGHTGTFESIPMWATGVSGSAISLDGVASHVSAPAAVWSGIDTQFTVSFWAQGDAALANNWGFFAGIGGTRAVSCHLPWGPEVIFDTTLDWADERIIVPAADDELRGQWRHWTMVRNTDTGEKKVYMDGLLYGSTTPSADPINSADIEQFLIGAGDGGGSPYMGLIDEFKVYNRALSAEEALSLAGVTSIVDKPF